MASTRLDEFLNEIAAALRNSVEVQRAFAQLRDELELAFDRFACTDAGREANRERLSRLQAPLRGVRRLDDDARLAAAFLAPLGGRVLRQREEATAVLKGLLAALRACEREGRSPRFSV